METYFDAFGFLVVLLLIAILAFLLILLIYVYEMAVNRGRSTFYWILFSLVLTPILSMILLACIGETEDKRRERLFADSEYLRMMRNDTE